MPDASRRCTQIDIESLCLPKTIGEGDASNVDEKAAASDLFLVPSLTKIKSRPSQTVRSVRFPVNAYGISLSSPWSSYKEMYRLRLGVDFRVTVAQQTTYPFNLVSLRCVPGPICNDKMHMLQQLRHENLVTVLETFRFEEKTHVAFEHMQISLHEIVHSPSRPDTISLAAILGQVRNSADGIDRVRVTSNRLSTASLTLPSGASNRLANMLQRPTELGRCGKDSGPRKLPAVHHGQHGTSRCSSREVHNRGADGSAHRRDGSG
ncbi:hypothetical protein BU23DRAFT_556510 [Bimuria novae-zelandiae CBS 107.79]|uniref:Protein kinase domain-containing protein n=1 Tax=Bimuria novae-zelandiae CBS 107.79 TaxID=1447943 RepID=A0A6A5V293_9PLEO|nr:hypothetical protein BU23DRAFT_556510 [Bimuria novae-zelandiae CBS 107.79]